MAGQLRPEGNSLYRPLAEINVTPLVDVMLVLLIVFMITAPLLATGMRVDLPQAKAATPVDPKPPVIVTVRKDGATYLGSEELSRSSLGDAMRAKIGADPATLIHLRGDREASYGEIIAVMDELARSGFPKIALITTSKGRAPDQAAAPAPAATP